jgi:2-dehydro-3-deoxyphosphooctonate aldolase (KDO 8-P synthase)
MKLVNIQNIQCSNNSPVTLIAGPCQLESLDHSRQIVETLISICSDLSVPFVFKGSFDKANRTSLEGKRGLGMHEGLSIMSKISDEFGCPTLTDIHSENQCAVVAEAVDVLQIPAFLCRQTDLLLAAGETGAVINIKKGQFLAPGDMKNVADNERILLTDRGTSFGYNMLVSDFRGLPIMAATGYPVVFDATHSVQLPGGQGKFSGGKREFVPPLARAAVAVGCAALFVETHPEPENAPSDGPNMVPLGQMADMLKKIVAIDRIAKQL